jgi:hypothetical protein
VDDVVTAVVGALVEVVLVLVLAVEVLDEYAAQRLLLLS